MSSIDLLEEKYLDLSEDEIDNLLYGMDLNKKQDTKGCINCGSEKLVVDNTKGYTVCEECAVINEEFLDKNQEFTNDPTGNSRYGCPSNFFFPKSALGTKIQSKGYNRLSALQRQGQMPYKEKSLMDVLERIQEKCKKYVITQTIIDTAKILYKRVSECKHTKGKRKGKNMIMRCINRRSMIAACVFHACKLQKEPRSPKEIADIYDLEIRHVNRGCRKFIDFIDITTIYFEIKSSQSSDFIERFAKKLNIEKQYIDKAKDISSNIHKLGLATTHEPPSVAAGCILLIENMYHIDISKKNISEIFGISDVTISKTYRKIFPYHKIIMSNEVTNLILEKKNKIEKIEPTILEENLIIPNKLKSEIKSNLLSDNSDYESDSDSENEIDNENEIENEINNRLYNII
jgi:transcription initiation factor TFIIB